MPTPFQQAAMVSDVVNVVTNWGDHGIEFINTDVLLTLVRLPRGSEVGLVAEHRLEHDGVSVGTAAVVDRDGIVGTATVTALANGQAVDPRTYDGVVERDALAGGPGADAGTPLQPGG